MKLRKTELEDLIAGKLNDEQKEHFAVLMDSGEIYLGANVENASYPAGVCAEHNAIDFAVLHGERKIIAIAVVGGADYKVSDYCAPCGICRQVMRGFVTRRRCG